MARYIGGILNMTEREFYSLPRERLSFPPIGYMRTLVVVASTKDGSRETLRFVVQRVDREGHDNTIPVKLRNTL